MSRPTRQLSPEEDAAIREMYARKMRHQPPQGYVTLAAPIPFGSTDDKGPWGPNPAKIIPAGTTMKIVMVSRFGDCGLSDNLKADYGYDVRLNWEDAAMSNIRHKPTRFPADVAENAKAERDYLINLWATEIDRRTLGNRRDHQFVDATPDADLPRRILSAYIDESKIISTDDTLSQTMNGWQDERNAILRAALAKL